jgi:hypothetical protein
MKRKEMDESERKKNRGVRIANITDSGIYGKRIKKRY